MTQKKLNKKEKQELLSKLKSLKKVLPKKQEVKEEKKSIDDKIEFSQKPDFGVSRQSEIPLEELTTKGLRNNSGRNLEEEAQLGVVSDNRQDNITYGANTNLYNNKKGEDKYIVNNSLEKDISSDVIINDSIRRETNINLDRFDGYKSTSNAPQDTSEHLRRLENPHMEDFINKGNDHKYNPTKVIDILSADKKEADAKYKKGGIR